MIAIRALDHLVLTVASIDATTGPFCIKDTAVTACLTAPPTAPVALTGAIDTDASPLCATNTAAQFVLVEIGHAGQRLSSAVSALADTSPRS